MAKGTVSKEIITKKILETFEGSFINDKEIRIPIMEDGEEIQIKCTLTCAKTAVTGSGMVNFESSATPSSDPVTAPTAAPTEEEKARVQELLTRLGL